MTTLRFRLPVNPTEPLLLELDTHRGTANGREITLDAGGRLTIHLADGSTLTADLAHRPTIDLAPFPTAQAHHHHRTRRTSPMLRTLTVTAIEGRTLDITDLQGTHGVFVADVTVTATDGEITLRRRNVNPHDYIVGERITIDDTITLKPDPGRTDTPA